MESAFVAPGTNRLKTKGKSTFRFPTMRHSCRNQNNNINKNRTGTLRSNSLRNNSSHRRLNQSTKNSRCNQLVDNAGFVHNANINNGNDNVDVKNVVGDFTREAYNGIYLRLGHADFIPEDSIQTLFNDLKLYPSKEQVSEMLRNARQYGRRNGSSKYITFGEFCVLAKEMNIQNKHYRNRPIPKCVNNCEVFLGGSCNPTTWRADTAIPELQKHGITFYNPQVSMWVPELVAQEHDAKQAASVLLYVVDSQTRSTVGMIEVAYLVASGRCVIVVAHSYRPGQSIMGETITNREYKDLVEGQTTLLTLVRSKGIQVHKNLSSALQCTAKTLRNGTETPEDQLSNKLRLLHEVFDLYKGQNEEMQVFDFLEAYRKLTQEVKIPQDLVQHLNSSSNKSVSFERFCVLMAEFTTNNCDINIQNGWASKPFQRQCSTNNNTCNIDNSITNGTLEETKEYSYDVFLGGTQNSSNQWRENTALPILKKRNVTYDPKSLEKFEILDNKNVTGEDVLQWKQIIDKARVVLFVITDDTRSLTTMILAAHYLAIGQKMVLCVQQLPDDKCIIANENLSEQAIKDYNRGRVYIVDMAKRKQIPVFSSIEEAVERAADIVQGR